MDSTVAMGQFGKSVSAALFVTILFGAAILYSPEAQVSGSAGVSILEENVLYSYQESSRRKLRPEDYDDYFRKRRDGMLGAIQYAQPQFAVWRKTIAAAGIKLKPVPVFAELDGERVIRIELVGERGATELTLALDATHKAVDDDQVTEKLKDLSKAIEFEAFAKKWSEAGSPPHNPANVMNGAMEVRSFEKFTLAMAVTSIIRKELQPTIQKALAVRIDKISNKVSTRFSDLVKKGEMWIDPSTLIAYNERFGSLPSGEELNNPAASKFNFFGPLFDQYGGRTSTNFGVVAVSMLFLSKKKDWETDAKFGQKRGQFENWFSEVLKND